MSADTPQRLLLRVALKLLSLTALLFLLYALFNSVGEERKPAPSVQTLHIDLATLKRGTPQRIEWAGGPLQLLRMEDDGPLYLFRDRGGNLGCPLVWQPPGNKEAAQQPWPGGFRDQCSATWYRYDGTVLPNQGMEQNLQGPPHHRLPGNLLEIGVNGDNAAPAVSQ